MKLVLSIFSLNSRHNQYHFQVPLSKLEVGEAREQECSYTGCKGIVPDIPTALLLHAQVLPPSQ